MTFNLRKQALLPLGDMILPDPGAREPYFGMDQSMVDLEWMNGGQNLYTNKKNMVDSLGGIDAMREKFQGIKENPENSRGLADDVEQIQTMSKGKNKMIKPFNLKTAQEAQVPFDPMALNDSPELIGDQLDMQQKDRESYKKYNTHADLNNSLMEIASVDNSFQLAWNEIQKENPQEPDSAQAALKSYYDNFDVSGEEQKLADAAVIYKLMYGNEESSEYNVPFREVSSSTNEIIKKLAQNVVKNNNKKAYNLTKTAQHKSLNNVILYGPGETRIDPFLHQPVSDWHIVERNKGFGLVVDDIWNIDYETIWRENIMDKYSRPYKNKEGKWVGGYLNKRFETDSNVPETSNMQLKPGQRRRPILPEYGNTESRLQAARAAGDIEGSLDTSKPFNWKEASKKKS